MSKLRFVRKKKGIMIEEYLKQLPLSLSKVVQRTRLNMIKAKANCKGSNKNAIGDSCHSKLETTEHLMNCWKNSYITGVKLEEKMIMSTFLEELKQMAVGVIALQNYKMEI